MRHHDDSKYRLVKRVIDEWDPVDLLPHAPDDEYDPEIREITKLMNPSQSTEELAKIIESIFVDYFEDSYGRPFEECLVVAQKLLSAMSNT